MNSPAKSSGLLPSDSLSNTFRANLERLSALLADVGVKNWISRGGAELLVFPKLSRDEQMTCSQDLEFFLSSCDEVLEKGSTLNDSPAIAWQMLRKMGYSPKFDFFDKFKSGDVLQAYDLSNRQVFRDIEFFKYSSHCLEDLFTLRWDELSVRNIEFEELMRKLSTEMFTSNIEKSIDLDIPEHEFLELGSRSSYRCRIKLKSLVPLQRDRKLSALLVITRLSFVE